jgi:hypothetical protein
MREGFTGRTMNICPNKRRRKWLIGGGAACLLHGPGRALARAVVVDSRLTLELNAFGGAPGAKPAALIDAFERAFDALKAAGGGILAVPPGVYDFGNWPTSRGIVAAADLSDVEILAYGATFRLNTTRQVVPTLFYFTNPNNVRIAGAAFNDTGYDPRVDWRGMYCARAEADRPCRGFTMVDCRVDGAVGLFQSQPLGAGRFLMKNISLHGVVKNAYYGAGLTYVGDNANVDLVCRNVRRGCISFGLKNANLKLRMYHTADALGSNGFIALACEGESQGNVENVRIELDASGVASHASLVHFYHKQTEQRGYMRRIDAAVTLNDMKEGRVSTSMFAFDHELPDRTILQSTDRGWDEISLRGSVKGRLPGRVIHNPSKSTVAGEIYIDPELSSRMNLSELPSYFRGHSNMKKDTSIGLQAPAKGNDSNDKRYKR